MKNGILLVEPEFPIPAKSKNHSKFLPIGLLKLASYYRKKGHKIKLVRGNKEVGFKPNWILVTSLFTYWSKYVKETVQFYRKQFPKSKIWVGGIYASLMPKHCKTYTGCNKAFTGIHKYADICKPAYDLVDVDYQIIHAMRGCIRRCKFCGTWKVEPKLLYKKSIKKEICSNKLIFYDNNLLINPYIADILKEIAKAEWNGKPVRCESQSGFDGRILMKKSWLAKLLKKARFDNPRIAWDWWYSDYKKIKKQIDILKEAGYSAKEIYIFMIYNFKIPFEEMEKKRKKCKHWGVQIVDCRYRPLNRTFDNYKPQARKGQTKKDYYIHPKWTDFQVRQFRRNVREQNIEIRYFGNKKKYERRLEQWGNIRRLYKTFKIKKVPTVEEIEKSPRLQNKIKQLKERERELEKNKSLN